MYNHSPRVLLSSQHGKVDGPQELRLKAIQLDDVPAACKEPTPAEIARGVMERCKARAAEPTPAEIARGVMERCKVRAATDAAAEVARGVMERCKARAAADPVEIARGVMERCKARAAADAVTPAEVARGVMERCKARAAADAAPAEPTSVAEEESADTTCTLNVKMEIELSPYMKKVQIPHCSSANLYCVVHLLPPSPRMPFPSTSNEFVQFHLKCSFPPFRM
jgi:hypothetical protein